MLSRLVSGQNNVNDKRILLGGIPHWVGEWIEESFDEVKVLVAESADQAVEQLEASPWHLAFLDESLGQDRLEKISQLPSKPEILLSVESIQQAKSLKKTLEALQVRKVLVHPLEPDHLLSDLAVFLNLPRKVAPHTADPIQAIWERNLSTTMARLANVETAVAQVVEGQLEEEVRRTAERDAHRLVGSLGTFGLYQASRTSRSIEDHLRLAHQRKLLPGQIIEASTLVSKLRSEIESGRPLTTFSPGHAQRREVEVLFHGQPTEALKEAVGRRRWALLAAEESTDLLELVPLGSRAATVLVIPLPEPEFVEEFRRAHKDVPIIALVPMEPDPIYLAALGVDAIIEAPWSDHLIVSEVERQLSRTPETLPKVLAVDDDPAVLELITELLKGRALVTCISDPLEFWEQLHQVEPDLVFLEEELSALSGLEICRALRHSVRWRQLPVLLLTSKVEPEEITRYFAAGADDLIRKPLVGPELTARFLNRIERVRSVRLSVDFDPVTGVANRDSTRGTLQRFLELARRTGKPFCASLLRLREPAKADWTQLNRLGQSLLGFLRKYDYVCRWDNQEFLIGMFGIDRITASRRLRTLVGALLDESPEFRYSLGLVELGHDGESLEELVSAATRLLAQSREIPGSSVATVDKVQVVTTTASLPNQLIDVLLVEDDKVLAPLVLHALENRGYSATWYADGREALQALLAGTWRPRVVLLDIDLPGQNGLSVLRALRDERLLTSMKVIMLTVRASEEEVLQTLNLGAFDHVAKPFSLPILLEKIRHGLAS